jgi:hypothetical protein
LLPEQDNLLYGARNKPVGKLETKTASRNDINLDCAATAGAASVAKLGGRKSLLIKPSAGNLIPSVFLALDAIRRSEGLDENHVSQMKVRPSHLTQMVSSADL